MHGQTVYHQATPARFLGTPIRCTSQIGEPAILSERLRIPVISDFRPADLAAGGQGAPLVPMLDFCLFRHATKNRMLLNLGGIANVTALPAACTSTEVLAFDTGPASMLIDLLMQQLYNRRFDKNGAVAASGQVLKNILERLLTTPYFSAPAPKSCGREEFGPAFAQHLLTLCKGAPKHDVIATATSLTAATILDAYRRSCWPHLGQHAPLARATELIAAGGGTKNLTLMRKLIEGLAPLGVKVSTTASAGLPVEAKEAAAFALLGWLTWQGLPGNSSCICGVIAFRRSGRFSVIVRTQPTSPTRIVSYVKPYPPRNRARTPAQSERSLIQSPSVLAISAPPAPTPSAPPATHP